MIEGAVNVGLEAVIALDVLGTAGRSSRVAARIDTGYNGDLTLPPDVVSRLGLLRVGTSSLELANGQEETFDTFIASVDWSGTKPGGPATAASKAPTTCSRSCAAKPTASPTTRTSKPAASSPHSLTPPSQQTESQENAKAQHHAGPQMRPYLRTATSCACPFPQRRPSRSRRMLPCAVLRRGLLIRLDRPPPPGPASSVHRTRLRSAPRDPPPRTAHRRPARLPRHHPARRARHRPVSAAVLLREVGDPARFDRETRARPLVRHRRRRPVLSRRSLPQTSRLRAHRRRCSPFGRFAFARGVSR